jgi:putative transposase
MPLGLQRYYGQHDLHFVTFTCYHRVPLLRSVSARNLFVKVLGEVRDGYRFALVGFVVMPEHVHLLVGESHKGTPSTVLQVIKQRAARELREHCADAGRSSFRVGDEVALPQFWQRRFYNFNVWSRKKRIEKLGYMHMNPVMRGLAASPADWAWSSFGWYQGRDDGLIRIDPV